jgi:hypothetical protein
MAFSDHVHPHGDLQRLAPGLWQVEGTLGRSPLPRAMVVHRLHSGELWLHSVIALDAAHLAELDALGPVRFIVVPSRLHRVDAPAYAERYPEAQVVCAAEARDAVAQVVRVDGVVEDVLPQIGIVVHHPPGIVPGERCYELPVDDGVALVFCDALFNLQHRPGCSGLSLKLMGSSGFFGTTRIGRFMTTDRAGWKGWLLQQAERDDLKVLSVAHGDAITTDCAARLREAAERL